MARAAQKAQERISPQSERRLRAVAGAVGEGEAAETDRLLYDRIRLGIMSALSVNRMMSFSELNELLGTTDGNLSKHARRLEDAGLVAVKKTFTDRTPRTQFRLTPKGKRLFERHLQDMEALIEATRGQ